MWPIQTSAYLRAGFFSSLSRATFGSSVMTSRSSRRPGLRFLPFGAFLGAIWYTLANGCRLGKRCPGRGSDPDDLEVTRVQGGPVCQFQHRGVTCVVQARWM